MVDLGLGGRAGAGWRGAGRARGRSTQPGAIRPARTGHGRVGRALSLGLELLLELLDLPREIEGGAARVVGVRASACNGTPAGRHRAVGGATGVACRVCVQLRLGAWHVPVSRADERATAVASVGA